ncbi:hypothetical protein GQ53DRAFT_759748 [Thozetella sp. PMI_491]|nr:hypothetical protein GQ53DRAFT_759748 [Thozetella sp. PMI_491]
MKFSATTFSALLSAGLLGGATASITWGTMYDATNLNCGAGCTDFQSDVSGQCISFTGGNTAWNDRISSLRVNGGAACQFFTDAGCAGRADTFTEGAYNTLPVNDQYSAFRCTFV